AGHCEGVAVAGEGVDVDAVALETDAVEGGQGVVRADVRAGLLDEPLQLVGVDRGHRFLRGMLVLDPRSLQAAGGSSWSPSEVGGEEVTDAADDVLAGVGGH